MKIFRGKWGFVQFRGFALFILLFFLPVSLFSQQKKKSVDTLAVEKNKQLILPDSLKAGKIPINTTVSDSMGKRQIIFKPDSTIDILQNVKPNYTSLEVKIVINSGARYALTREVMLYLTAPQAKEMLLSNDKDFSGAKWEPFQPSRTWTIGEKDGNQKVYFQARYPDSTLSKVVFDEIILNSAAPVVSFRVTPDSGIAGETQFSFDASASSHRFDISVRWDWDDDGKFDTGWSTNLEAAHLYRFGGGSKTIKLQVKDETGWVVSASQSVLVYSRPYPDFNYTQDFADPLKFTFDASGSGDYEDGNNLQFRWDFNADSLWDSEWSPEKTITHKFEDFHETRVIVEAKDSQGLTNTFSSKVSNRFDNMVFVPAGDFVMGCDTFEIDERPAHEVYVDDFWINKYPVTNLEYADFLNQYLEKYPQRGADVARYYDLSANDSIIYYDTGVYKVDPLYENHPVVNVTWYGADAYCRFFDMRLPTEAEWEKAARGMDGRIFPWGDSADSSRANYWDSQDPYDNSTTPVGFYNGQYYQGFQTRDGKSYFGAYDMAGNVKEWTADWYLRNYYSQAPRVNPPGPREGSKKVIRGGGYLFHREQLRVTYRYSMPPDKTANFVGFRCVKSR